MASLSLTTRSEATDDSSSGISTRFTPYWISSRFLMLLWLLLSLWQIGAFPLTVSQDEALNVLAGMRLASSVDDPAALLSPAFQDRMPFAYLPTAIGVHLFPVNEFTLRLPYALIGAAQMPLLLLLVSRSFGKQAAVIAGLLLLGSGLFALNRLATGFSVFVVLELASALFLLRYVDSGERRWFVFASLAFAAAALVFAQGIFVLVAALGAGWWIHRNRNHIGIAVLAGLGSLAAVMAVTALAEQFFDEWSSLSVTGTGMVGGFFSGFTTLSAVTADLPGAWLVYVGVPALLLISIGLAEALVHHRSFRVETVVLLVLSAAVVLPIAVFSGDAKGIALAAPFLVAVSASGWARLIQQIDSIAARASIVMVVAGVAMAGIAWNQAVFSPESEFTENFAAVRQYATSVQPELIAVESSAMGIKSIGDVLRSETQTADTILVRDQTSVAAISLYGARRAEKINLDELGRDSTQLDGAYLVIRGEDEAFNGGLSGTTNVVENHRIFADGEVLYQLVKFRDDGEQFETPVWWRADVVAAQFDAEHTAYSDFLAPRTE